MSVSCRILKNRYCEITQYYGGDNNHLGIDIVGQNYILDTVLAHTSGRVSYIQTGYTNNQGTSGNASYGNMIKIDHGNGWTTLYAHLDRVYVTNGQEVNKGQEIGYMGNTGNSYGAHLHFELLKNNSRVNPLEYLDKNLFDVITDTVERNENNNQLKVNVDNLRVRVEPGTNNGVLGFAKLNGIYNYYEVVEKEGYTWYRIAEGQWVANKDNWCTLYPKDGDEQLISDLNNIIEEQKVKIKELEDKIIELQKEDNSIYNVFVAPNTDNYYIKLTSGQKLIYKKD